MNEKQRPYPRDELLRSRDPTLTRQEGCEGPDYLLLPHSLLATEAAVTTFQEEALCALLQLRGRSLAFGALVQMAESLDLVTQDHRQIAWAKSAGGAARSKSEKARTFGAEVRDGDHPVNRSCSLEHWLRASIRRRPDLFHVDCETSRLQQDTKVSLVCTVPLRYFQIPLINMLNPNSVPVADSPQAHLTRMFKALTSEKRYLALFDQDLSEASCKLHGLASSQDALMNAVYGHLNKKVAYLSRPAGKRGDAARRLVKAFQQHVEEDGYFSSQAVLAELEFACRERRLQDPLDLLQDKEIGSIFMTLMKIQLFIDTTIWTTFALLPIVTFYDLETMILKGTDFQHLQQHGYRFKRSGFGNLVYHPAVRANLSLVQKDDHLPAEFPKITGEQLLNLMVEGWLTSDGSFDEKTFENTWNVEAGLIHAAKCLNLPDYGHIGVRVQRENLVKAVVKQVVQRRSNLMKHINNVVKRESEAGHIGCGFQWATDKCQRFFQALTSLKSPFEQLQFIREFLLQELSMQHDLDAIEKIVAPLLLVATSAAHITGSNHCGEQGVERLAATVQQLQDLLPSGRSLHDVVDASKDKSAAKAFLKCERELVELCGLSHASDLPLSVAELMELRPELATNLTSTEQQNAAEQNPSWLCPSVENEQIVFQYFESALHMNALAKGSHSLTWLLETVGLCEDEICRQGNVSSFSELGLNYGNFLAHNASDIAALLDARFITSQTPLSLDLASVCERLKAKGCNGMEAKWAIRGHFASAISDVEADTAWDRVTEMADVQSGSMAPAWVLVAKGHSPQPGKIPPSVERQQLILNAIEQIASAPFLMDLKMAVDWEEMFQPILGELDIFLSSKEFATAWESQAFNRDSHIICLRWQHFARLPLGPAMFRKALAADDPVAAAAFVLSRWLQDCHSFSCEQYMDLVEDHLLRNLQGNAKEIFVLHAISVLPKEWRDPVAPVFAKAYIKLALPKNQMISMAKLRPEWTLALRWFARFAGHRDWELKWEEFYSSSTGIWLPEKAPEKLEVVERPTTLKATRRPETERSEGNISDSDAESSEDEDLSTPTKDEDMENGRLCREIARNKGVKWEDMDLTREWKPPANKVYRSLQNTVRAAVKRLAEELYSAEVHFVLELLQNADDCEFPEGVVPSLTVTFEHDPNKLGEWTSFLPVQPPVGVLIVEHNELGFCDQNVVALCDLGHSTKVGSRKFIGAKGIGFKSTFCATSTPIVHSGRYHFHFDKEALNGLGYLIPFPLKRPGSFTSGTRIVLPIYDETKVAVCRRVLEDLRPELLLFLRKLAKITIADKQVGIERTRTIQMRKTSSDEVRLDTSETSTTLASGKVGETEDCSSLWHVHRRPVSLPRAAGSESTDLQIAFRQNDKKEQLPAFAWLPLRSYGFRFIVQADWEVSSSREAILAERSRNQCLRSSLPEIFCELVEELAAKALTISEESERDSAFRTLYNLIPLRNETVEFFADSSRSILEGLKSRQFILVRAGSSQKCVTPAEVVRKELDGGIEAVLKSEIKDLIEPILNSRKMFFETGLLGSALAKDLEIPNLDKSIASKTLEALSSEQRQSVSDDLLEAIHLLLRIMASANVNQSVIDKMRTLYIIPTQSGKLCSSNDTVYMVDETTANTLQGYAEGLNLQFRQIMHRDVEHFLRRLGVRQTDSARFLKEILIPILTAGEALDRHQLIDVTQKTLQCLSLFKSPEIRHQFVKDLQKAMWVVVDSFDSTGCETVRLADTDVHIFPLPLPLRREWQGRNWWCVSTLYGSGDCSCSLSWNDFWKDLGCWPLLCMKEHTASQLTLSTSPDFVDIIETLNAMKSKSGTMAYEASVSLVQWFVQHSQHASCYSRYFPSQEDKDDAMQDSGTFANMFCNSAWLPTAAGGVVSHRLLSLKEGWIRETEDHSSNPLLASACFHHDVGQLAKAWTFLNFSRGKPDAVALVQILKAFRDCHHRFSRTSVIEFYELLRGQIRGLSAEWQEDIRGFLLKEAWIFLPDRRDRKQATEDYRREFQGRFFPVADLANNDASALFCTWKKQVTDEMAEIAGEAVHKQCIEKYYPGSLKRFFEDWGVRVRIGWDAYLQVLHAVHQRVCANAQVSSKEAGVLHEVVLRLMAALGTAQGDHTREIDDDDHEPDDCPEAREDALEMESEKQLLQRFISEAQELRVICTVRFDFKTPADVIFYTAENLWDWNEAAQHFVVKIPNLKGPWVGGFKALGLRSTSAVDLDHICIVPSRSVEEQETKLARAIFLAAVRICLDSSTHDMSLSKILWHLAVATNFFSVKGTEDDSSKLQVQCVVMQSLKKCDSMTTNMPSFEHPKSSIVLASRKDLDVVATIKAPEQQPYFVGFGPLQFSQSRQRQLAVALDVSEGATCAMRMGDFCKEIAEGFMCSCAAERSGELRKMGEEVKKTIRAIAKQVKDQRTSGPGLNVLRTIQAVAAWKAQIAKHPSSIESLESALAMEPGDAWDRFLSQKDLQASNDQETPDQPEPDQAQETQETESDAPSEESLGGDLATFIKKAVEREPRNRPGNRSTTFGCFVPFGPGKASKDSHGTRAWKGHWRGSRESDDHVPADSGYADFDESSAGHTPRHQQFHGNTWSDWDDWESTDWDQDSRNWGHNTWAHSQGTFDVWNRGSLENPWHHEESGWAQSIRTNSRGWSEGEYQQDHEEEKFAWFSTRKGTEATPDGAALGHQSFDDNAGRGCGSGEAFLRPDPPSTVHQSSSQMHSIYGQGHWRGSRESDDHVPADSGYADFDESSAGHTPRHQQFHGNTWSDWDDWESTDWGQDSRNWGQTDAEHGHEPVSEFIPDNSNYVCKRWISRGRAAAPSGSQARASHGRNSVPLKRSFSAPAEVGRTARAERPTHPKDVDDNNVSKQVRARILESMLETFPSHFKTNLAVAEMLWGIHFENGGPDALYSDNLEAPPLPFEAFVAVDEIFYTHEYISPVFNHGVHRGKGLHTLVEDLCCGRADLHDPLLRLEVVKYHERLHSLCNRRLYAFNCYQDRLREDNPQAKIYVRVRHRPLCAVTAKFVLAFTSTSHGQVVHVRPTKNVIHSRASTNPCKSYAQDVPGMDSTKRSFLDDPWADGIDPWSAARRKLGSE